MLSTFHTIETSRLPLRSAMATKQGKHHRQGKTVVLADPRLLVSRRRGASPCPTQLHCAYVVVRT